MKHVAVLAVLLGVLVSGANAESAVSEAPELTLSTTGDNAMWVVPATAINIQNEALADQIELKASQTKEEVTTAMEQQLEEKFAKELKYAMQ